MIGLVQNGFGKFLQVIRQGTLLQTRDFISKCCQEKTERPNVRDTCHVSCSLFGIFQEDEEKQASLHAGEKHVSKGYEMLPLFVREKVSDSADQLS